MSRVRIPLVVLGPDGRPLAGATAAVRRRSDGTAVTVYAADTGGVVLAANQVVSDAHGRIPGWTDRNALEATVTGPDGSGLDPYIEAWDAMSAVDGVVWLQGAYADLPDPAVPGTRYYADDEDRYFVANTFGGWAELVVASNPAGAGLTDPFVLHPRQGFTGIVLETANGTVNSPASYSAYPGHAVVDPFYIVDAVGIVHLGGGFVPNVAPQLGTRFATLPAAARPNASGPVVHEFHIVHPNAAVGMLKIRSDGKLEYGLNAASAQGVSLAGISYPGDW